MDDLGGVIMTIKDLDTETLTLLSKLSDGWCIKSCPAWLIHLWMAIVRIVTLKNSAIYLTALTMTLKKSLQIEVSFDYDSSF